MKEENKFYYKDGTTSSRRDFSKTLHRIDGPAVEHYNGDEEWYINGSLHRTDGPAVEWGNGTKYWFVDGIYIIEEEFHELINSLKEINIALKLTDPRWWVRELGEKEVVQKQSILICK
jgi:hypothetical protein